MAKPTDDLPPAGRRTRLGLGLVAWLWVAGLVAALLLAQELGFRMRALLFIAGFVLLLRLVGWILDLFKPDGE